MLTRSLMSILIVLISFSTLTSQTFDRSGGYARVMSLGYNPYVVDPEFIKYNPAWTGMYKNFVWGDFGGSSFGPYASSGQFVGFNFGITDNLTLGAMLTRDDFMSVFDAMYNFGSIGRLDPGFLVPQINSIVGAGSVVPLNNNIEVLGSFRVGQIIIGAGISYAASTNELKPAVGGTQTGSASQIGFNAGLLMELSRKFTLDASVMFMSPSASFEPATGTKTELSQTFIGAQGRLFWKFNNNVSFVPAVKFYSASGTVDAGGKSSDLNSITLLNAGFGIQYRNDDFMLVGGPALQTISTTFPAVPTVSPELTTSSFYFPVWNLGAEWFATDWLTARAGYIASTYSTTNESAASVTTKNETTITGYMPGNVTLGLGFRFGGFALDATMNVDVLRQGLNNIGGGTPTFAYISSSYAF